MAVMAVMVAPLMGFAAILKCFLGRLMDSQDKSADSIIFCMLFATATLCVGFLYSVWHDPAHLSASDFGMGEGLIMAGGGGAKMFRDKINFGSQPPTQ